MHSYFPRPGWAPLDTRVGEQVRQLRNRPARQDVPGGAPRVCFFTDNVYHTPQDA